MAKTLMRSDKEINVKDSFRRTLETQVRGLQDLINGLDDSVAKIADVLLNTKGRIVVTGMGKSGHVARKISATLASTGAPSIFVHPGEASHGDMGMILENDTIIALSRNGTSNELSDIIQYAKRFNIPLIAMTVNDKSPLGTAADYVLRVPDSLEACPLGMAPTTSTTQMMVLGDALAVALLELRGFTKDDFKVFHPGGKLGARLKRVHELMHSGDALPLVKPSAEMSDAILVFTQKNMGSLGIVDESGLLLGIITDGDLKRHMGPDFLTKNVSDIMTKNPITIRPGALAEEALNVMNDKRITNLFVVENKKPVGIIHVHDILRAGVV